MKIASVRAKKFRRFEDLTISGIPESAKLVVLVGPNGSGRSAVFDALSLWMNIHSHRARNASFQFDKEYYVRGRLEGEEWQWAVQQVEVKFHDWEPKDRGGLYDVPTKALYFRSAYRHEADFSVRGIAHLRPVLADERNPHFMHSPDMRVSDNYQRMILETIERVYELGDDAMTKAYLREIIMGDVRASFGRVFENLSLTGPGNPLEGGTFLFEKGASKDFRYKNLSGGEKAGFDLLLDFVLKTRHFDDTVYCIDEPELHMHTSLQSKLLEEMYRLLPEKCQLWIASHSIGMIRKAKELHQANQGRVVFLDFGGQDFDGPVELTPLTPTRAFWKRTFSVALGDLADLVAPERVVFCEGGSAQQGAKKGADFDARCYEAIFEAEHPDVAFVSLGSAEDVEKNAVVLETAFRRTISGVSVTRLVDRDDRSVAEVGDMRKEGCQVLSRRSIESYLWDDEVINKLCEREGKAELFDTLLSEKKALLASNVQRGKPPDDHKAISGQLYVQTKKLLELSQCGSTAEEFAVQTLAPLITPDTTVYQQLKADIFG